MSRQVRRNINVVKKGNESSEKHQSMILRLIDQASIPIENVKSLVIFILFLFAAPLKTVIMSDHEKNIT